MAEIDVTNLVDEADLARVLAAGPWYLHEATGYLRAKGVYLHHFIYGARTPGLYVDHIDMNKLNNHRSNLREVTPGQSAQNRAPRPSTHGQRGVLYHGGPGRQKRYEARVQVADVRTSLGYYATAEEAAEVSAAWRAEHMTHSAEYARG